MKSLPYLFLFVFVFLLHPLAVQAGDVITESAAYEAAICGSVVDNDFGDVQLTPGDPLSNHYVPGGFFVGPADFETAWGSVSTTGLTYTLFIAGNNLNGMDFGGYIWQANEPNQSNVWTMDAGQGPVEGFGFTYYASENVSLKIFDRNQQPVETLTVPAGGVKNENDIVELAFFGWLNTEGVDVGSIEVVVADTDPTADSELIVFVDVDVSFGIYCPPGPQSGVNAIILDLDNQLPTGDPNVDAEVQCAIDHLNAMQDPIYWDDADHLSVFGKDLFNLAASAAKCMQSPSLDDSQIAIQQVLSTLVATAIQDAIDRGGREHKIDNAISLELQASDLEANGNYALAAKFRRRAWNSAFKA